MLGLDVRGVIFPSRFFMGTTGSPNGMNHRAHREHGEMERDSVTQAIIGAAIQVHTELGPGLLESTYEVCLAYELASRGLDVLH